MQTQPAISPLTGPGTGRLKLSAYGSQAYSSRIPFALLSRGYPNAISPRKPDPTRLQTPSKTVVSPEFHPKPAPNPNRCPNLAVTHLDARRYSNLHPVTQ
jgi:hypothetical protein